MTTFLLAFLEKYLLRAVLASFLFVLLIPLYLLVFQPHKDIRFHSGNPEVVDLNAASLRDNLYARASGRIDPDSVTLRTNLLKTKLTGCLFRLTDFPEQCVVHLRQGKLFDQLQATYAEYRQNKYKNAFTAIADGRKPPLKKVLDDEKVMALLRDQLTASPVTLQGRIYDATGCFEVFDRYLHRDEADIPSYFREHNGAFNAVSKYRQLFEPRSDKEKQPPTGYFLLHAGETPGLAGLADTSVMVFLVAIAIVTLVLAWLAFALLRIAWRVAIYRQSRV